MTAAPAAVSAPPARRVTLAHRAEFAALRSTIGALSVLPWNTAVAMGARLGLLGHWPVGIRRTVVREQIAFAFPELSQADVERIARASYISLGTTTIETALMASLDRQHLLDLVSETKGFHHFEEAHARGRGVIVVTGHLGNWELGGAYLAARGVPMDAIVRRQGNPLFDRYLNETRRTLGIEIVNDFEAVRRIPRSLKAGRTVGFIADQGLLNLASTFVPFFGRLAKTPRGPGVFALRMGIPVVFAAMIRQADGRYHMNLEPVPVHETGDREADVDRVVADYTQVLERWVRQVPEQYFWHHKRWKWRPPGAEGTE